MRNKSLIRENNTYKPSLTPILDSGPFGVVCVTVAVAPLMRGAVHPWAETVIQMLVLTGLMLLWLGRQMGENGYRISRAAGGHRSRSGRTGSRHQKKITQRQMGLAVMGLCLALGVWSTIWSPQKSLAMEGLTMLVVYLLFFYLVMETAQHRREQRILVWVIVGTAVVLALIGLLKRYEILTLPWWDYAAELGEGHGSNSLSGVYVNRNHMAGFLEMSIPLFLMLFLTRSRSPEINTAMVCTALFLIICQALTLSRGGWAGTFGALVFMTGVLLAIKAFQQKRLLLVISAGVVVVTLAVLASTPVVERITTLTQRDMEDNLTGRLTYWDGTREMIKAHRLTGTGPGTFKEAFPAWQKPGYYQLPVYAHNDYLQFTSDVGILVLPLMILIGGVLLTVGLRQMKSPSRQTRAYTLGAMAGIVAIAIHSFSDFNLHIPANILLFTSLTALVITGDQL